jgi:prepilin-type N-terminal cleavage/methylation domain-containing protein
MARFDRLVTPALRRFGVARRRMLADDDGFTLIEMVIAISLAAVVFMALAFAMAGGLRATAVAKNRTRGDEVATAAIEDLQRFDYDHLGLCPSSGSGVTDTGTQSFQTLAPVTLNCAAGTVLEEPCTPVIGPVPKASYACTVQNIVYSVQRYVVWGDAAQTKKRLAVFVDWTDLVGRHEVSQQSSLRSPVQGSVVGISPPSFVTGGQTVTPTTVVLNSDGTNQSQITLSAQTTGLSASDTVTASLLTVGSGSPTNTSIPLASVDGTHWNASIAPSAYAFGTGTQYIVFSEQRSSDGKANAMIYTPAVTFCPSGCSTSGLPTITGSAPSTVDIDPGGLLNADISISAQTTGVAVTDSVFVTFATQSGAVTIALQPSDGTGNNWTGSIARAAGYRFSAGTQRFVFTALHVDSTSGNVGSTAAAQSGTVSFQ